jgi:methylated-DNA-[protein]-cysteine S-methyltransferase
MNATPTTTPLLFTTWESPVGELLLTGDERGALRSIQLPRRHARSSEWQTAGAPFAEAIAQLSEYFAGERRTFDLELAPRGGGFDQAVWERVAEIPYGETRSYGQVAREIGHPDRARAVGSANGRNPLPIVIPCHRVIGADGSLVGYGGGLELKRRLLELEAGAAQQTLI